MSGGLGAAAFQRRGRRPNEVRVSVLALSRIRLGPFDCPSRGVHRTRSKRFPHRTPEEIMRTADSNHPKQARASRSHLATAATALAFGVIAVGAGAADAASCYGDYCSGQDPAATGCDRGATTIAVRSDIVGARLDMRWSRKCKTAWARWQQYPRGWNLGSVLLELRTVQDTGYMQLRSWPNLSGPGDNTTTWSPMVYSPHRKVRAEAVLSCGGMSKLDAAFDCATNGKIATAMK
jgi:hypothetical protein